MKLLITGGSGLIGSALIDGLKNQHQMTVLGRTLTTLQARFKELPCLTWKSLTADRVAQYDVIINLAGENIGRRRWSSRQKQRIIASRVNTTTRLATYCAQLGHQSPRLFNASAIGIYGLPLMQDEMFDESSILPEQSTDFLSQVGRRWEQSLQPAIDANVSVVALRFGVVLTRKGGVLAKLFPSFMCGLGAVLGNGKQAFSWVTLTDVVRAVNFLLEQPQLGGGFNIVASEVVTQAVFAKSFAAALHRPCLMRLPALMVKLLFGQMGDELLLQGQRVKATRLVSAGFQFQDHTLKKALKAIL